MSRYSFYSYSLGEGAILGHIQRRNIMGSNQVTPRSCTKKAATIRSSPTKEMTHFLLLLDRREKHRNIPLKKRNVLLVHQMVRYYQRDALRTGSREGFYSYLPSLARKASMDGALPTLQLSVPYRGESRSCNIECKASICTLSRP